MKMTHRFLAAAATVCMAIGLTACGNSTSSSSSNEPKATTPVTTTTAAPKPEELYRNGLSKIEAMTSAHIVIGINQKQNVAGTESQTKISIDTYREVVDGKEVLKQEMKMSVAGLETTTPIYTKDGYQYMEVMGIKMKQKVEENAAEGEMEMLEFSDAALKNATLSTKDGKTVVECTTKADDMKAAIAKQLEATESVDITISDVTGKFVFDKDGYMVDYSAKYSYEMTMEGVKVTGEYEMTMTMPNPGEKVTVTLPDDLDSYVDASALGGDEM